MFINKNFLKFFYNALLTGMPTLTYNPINKNILHAPFIVDEHSTYINYRLNNDQINRVKQFINDNNNDLNIAPASLIKDNSKDYFLSINIYNCTSPIFSFIDDNPVTRCEVNMYVYDKNNEKGTLIMDYVSNILSLDPENLFKKGGDILFNQNNNIIKGHANNNNFKLDFNYDFINNIVSYNSLSENLIKFTDKIYYNNGLYDKLYYDSSLIHNKIIDCKNFDVKFNFLNIDFQNVDSIFYFKKKINFVGGLWYNLYLD